MTLRTGCVARRAEQQRATHTHPCQLRGGLAVLPQDLQIDQRVSVINLVSSQTSPAVIVWRGHEGTEGWELGIELINPDMGFWGINL